AEVVVGAQQDRRPSLQDAFRRRQHRVEVHVEGIRAGFAQRVQDALLGRVLGEDGHQPLLRNSSIAFSRSPTVSTWATRSSGMEMSYSSSRAMMKFMTASESKPRSRAMLVSSEISTGFPTVWLKAAAIPSRTDRLVDSMWGFQTASCKAAAPPSA